MWLKINKNYSPNFNPIKRPKKKIKFIIIHYTGMKKESLAIERLCDFNSNVSAHYFVKKNGDILNLIPDLYEAWHAGKSRWGNYKSLNKNSIGIEIQNSGHDNKYEKFTLNQINTLKKLLKKLIINYKINQKNILGHSDIAPDRKMDPGEKFPWKNLSKLKLAFWHNLNEKKVKKLRLIKLNKVEEKNFFKNINKIGYRKIKKSNISNNKILIKSFQRRFRQSLINGIVDQECLIISKNLLKS
jgi:N-acetylmuramoyl-L-alanine amidase